MQDKNTMNLWSVTALGIGSMIGAGIFTLLGQATLLAGRDVVLSFLLAGVVALFSGYSYARLAARFPTSGGIMDYFAQGFSPLVAGSLSLLYLITLAISISMLAKTFGEYAGSMLMAGSGHGVGKKILVGGCSAGVVVLLTGLNMYGSAAVGRAEGLLVAIKLVILLVLIVAGLPNLDFARVYSEPQPGTLPFFGSVGLTFFAFAGFGMMTNAAANVAKPKVTIPIAIFLAISIVIVVYVALSLVVLGNIDYADMKMYADTAVAQAAKPVLGQAGFFIVSCAALLATTSGINAMLFSSMNIADAMAKKGQLPRIFSRVLWRQGSWGLALAVLAVIVVTLTLDLSLIATVASSTFLLCYLAIFLVHGRMYKETESSLAVIGVGFSAMFLVFVAFMQSLWSVSPYSILLVGGALLLALCVQVWLQRKG